MRPPAAPILVAALLLPAATGMVSAGVAESKHNLSVSGRGDIVAAKETEICIFCHTPHGSGPATPLWNRVLPPMAPYSAYSSSTLSLSGPIPQPGGASKLCLSCHDGTVALGQTLSAGLIELRNAGPSGKMPAGASLIGTDLSDDHPVSFEPNPSLLSTVDPPPEDSVSLDSEGKLQCTSCHDPHEEDRDPVVRRFLVKSNKESGLCLTCHRIEQWDGSAHQSSGRRYSAAEGAHTGYETVAENGCSSCHVAHSAAQPQRLLKGVEEAACLSCHNGSVASTDIAAEYAKPFAHPTLTMTPSSHDPSEEPSRPSNAMPEIVPSAPRHAECADCHDPHAARSSSGGVLPGSLAGAWGIDSDGTKRDEATADHEICYKCHGDSANKPQRLGLPSPPYIRRQVPQFNVRLEFDPMNPSHHAVEAPGRNPDVPSLLPGYTTASLISCIDCHNNDEGPGAGGSGPRGPHGSSHQRLLERSYTTGSNNAGSNFGSMYGLCFKCHDESSILNDRSFKKHRKHIEDEGASCSVCHDPHGVSVLQASGSDHTHLINFDLQVVQPNVRGELRFEDLGEGTGACYLTCHGVAHDPLEY